MSEYNIGNALKKAVWLITCCKPKLLRQKQEGWLMEVQPGFSHLDRKQRDTETPTIRQQALMWCLSQVEVRKQLYLNSYLFASPGAKHLPLYI